MLKRYAHFAPDQLRTAATFSRTFSTARSSGTRPCFQCPTKVRSVSSTSPQCGG